jgi:CubicO group peptidase (beta-lactamase class C family)
MSLVADGALELGTTARSLLRDDLPFIDDGVTVEHLLAHRSGIGDYLDEEDGDLDLTAHLLTVPVHRLASGSPTATAATSCSRSSRSARRAPCSTSSSRPAYAGPPA